MTKLNSDKYIELMERFDTARNGYRALARGAEASHMMLEQYVDVADLSEIKNMLDAILVEAKEKLSDYDEYLEITSAAISLANAVESTMYLARYVSAK